MRLASRKTASASSDRAVESGWQGGVPVRQAELSDGLDQPSVSHRFIEEGQVVAHASLEELHILVLQRVGLRLVSVGAYFGVGYTAIKITNMAVRSVTTLTPGLADAIIVVCFTTSFLLMIIGVTIPSWGPLIGLDHLADWASALRAQRQLAPLWAALHQADPSMALLPEPHGLFAPLFMARQARLRLVRRVVEIRDGYRSLRPYADDHTEHVARRHAEEAGLTEDELAVAVEAAVVAVAVRDRERGRESSPPANASGVLVQESMPSTPAAEVAWLTQVARAYRSSPVVAATLADVGDPR